jgi:hypothetical protein
MPTINNHLLGTGESMDPYFKYLPRGNEKTETRIMIYSPGFKTDICPLHSKCVALSKMSLTSNN